MEETDQPWALFGEGVVGFLKRPPRGQRIALPAGLRRVTGGCIFLAERFDDSPAGPFLVFSILEPVCSGLRVGLHATTTVVSSNAARRVLRARWGFPAEVGALGWHSDAETRSIAWRDGDFTATAVVGGKTLPFSKTVRLFQRTDDEMAQVSTKLKATVRSAQIVVEVPGAERLGFAGGVHRGYVLSGMRMNIDKAKSKRARDPQLERRRATEPGLLGMTETRAQD